MGKSQYDFPLKMLYLSTFYVMPVRFNLLVLNAQRASITTYHRATSALVKRYAEIYSVVAIKEAKRLTLLMNGIMPDQQI